MIRRKHLLLMTMLGGAALLLLALLLATAPAPVLAQGGGQEGPPHTGDNSYCLVCHAGEGAYTLPDGTVLDLQVAPQIIADSVHGTDNSGGPLGCVDCHGENAFPHDQALPADGRAYAFELSTACLTCHPAARAEEDHQNLFHGVHYDALAADDLSAPTCVDCHKAHDVYQPRQRVDERNYTTCGTCHEPETDMCSTCHTDIVSSWSSGVHSTAFTRDSFQAAWSDAGQPDECLSCHTTCYNPGSDNCLSENVVCEACHGVYAAGHPSTRLVVQASADMCSDCHVQTFVEWDQSAHAFSEDFGSAGCTTCHTPHGQNIRFEAIDDLCLNCHKAPPQDHIHITHNEVEFEDVEVNCASCHMHLASLEDGLHNLPDHTMVAGTDACNSCHSYLAEIGFQFVDINAAIEAERDSLQATAEALQGELAAAAAAAPTQESDARNLVQGLIAGLGIGITLVLILVRRRNGSEDEDGDSVS